MRLSCGRLVQCRVRSDCLSTKLGCIKIRLVFFLLLPVFCLLTTCLHQPSLPPPLPLLPPLLSSPRTGQRRQHRSSSPVVKTRRPSSMPKRRRGINANRSRERRSNAGKRQSDEHVKRWRPEHERTQRGPRWRRSAKHVSRQRRNKWRCSGGLPR